MARIPVVFPRPDGPNNTVHGCVTSNCTLSASAPTRCSILTARRLSDNVGPPSIQLPDARKQIDRHQRHYREAHQHQGGLARSPIVPLLTPLVARDRLPPPPTPHISPP